MTPHEPDHRIDLAALRRSYQGRGLTEQELAPEPYRQFRLWLHDAVASGLLEPNAMALATATPDGWPSVRHVLLKELDERGFVFFTNYGSRKARELDANPRAALTFPWFPMARQVVVEGVAERVTRPEVEAYWRTRPYESQLGSAASAQSTVVASRAELDARVSELRRRHPTSVPLPEWWGGYRVVPDAVEFWQGGVGRLHDRLRYRRTGDGWVIERLSP